MGDSFLRVDGMNQISIHRGEQSRVPRTLRLAARHHEVRPVGMPRETFHETIAGLSLFDLIDHLSFPPVPALPCHLPIAGHGILHRSHAAAEERGAIRREGQAINAAAVVMCFCSSPRREIRRSPLRHRPALTFRSRVPDSHLAHHVSGRQILAIGTERATEHGRSVAQRRNEVPSLRIEDLYRGLGFRRRLILPAAGRVLSRHGGQAAAVGRNGHLPVPEAMRLHPPKAASRFHIVPEQHPIVTAGNDSLPIREQDAAASIGRVSIGKRLGFSGNKVHRVERAIHACGEGAIPLRSDGEAQHAGGQFVFVSKDEFHAFTRADREWAPPCFRRDGKWAGRGGRIRRKD